MSQVTENAVRPTRFALESYHFNELAFEWHESHTDLLEALAMSEAVRKVVNNAKRAEEKAWVAMKAEVDRLHLVRTSE